MRHFLGEIHRMRWPLIISIGVEAARVYNWLPWDSHLTVVLHKPALALIGVICAHIVVQQAFPVIDMGDLLRRAENPDVAPGDRQVSALMFTGVCILRGGIYGAMILGVTLGL